MRELKRWWGECLNLCNRAAGEFTALAPLPLGGGNHGATLTFAVIGDRWHHVPNLHPHEYLTTPESEWDDARPV
jgi:hypothetical protein